MEPAGTQALKDFYFVAMVVIWRLGGFLVSDFSHPFFFALTACRGDLLLGGGSSNGGQMVSILYTDAQAWIMDSGVSPRKRGATG